MTETSRTRLGELFAILSRKGALAILEIASGGTTLQACSRAAGISDRQARSRLADLERAGLVEKAGRIYRKTRYGRILCSRYIPRLKDAFMRGRDGNGQTS